MFNKLFLGFASICSTWPLAAIVYAFFHWQLGGTKALAWIMFQLSYYSELICFSISLLCLLVNFCEDWNKIFEVCQQFNELLHDGISSDVSLCIHQVIKEDLERAYKNTNMKPMSHSSYLRLQVLREIFWDVDEKLGILMKLTFTDLVTFIPKILSQVRSKWPPSHSHYILSLRYFCYHRFLMMFEDERCLLTVCFW